MVVRVRRADYGRHRAWPPALYGRQPGGAGALERAAGSLEVVVVTLIKAAIVIGGLLTGFAYLTLFESKVHAPLQQRPGPNRVGPWGLLQPLAERLMSFFNS